MRHRGTPVSLHPANRMPRCANNIPKYFDTHVGFWFSESQNQRRVSAAVDNPYALPSTHRLEQLRLRQERLTVGISPPALELPDAGMKPDVKDTRCKKNKDFRTR